MSQCDAVVVEASASEVLVEVPGRAPACGSCETQDACQTGLLVLLAIAGAAIGQSVAGDPGAAAGTLAGLGCGLLLLRRKELRARHDASLFSLQVQTKEVRFKEKS